MAFVLVCFTLNLLKDDMKFCPQLQCIMQCIYEKNHAVDKLGWPTLDGLVNFHSEGVNEHGYFMATLRAADYCLKGASAKYHVNRRSTPGKHEHKNSFR